MKLRKYVSGIPHFVNSINFHIKNAFVFAETHNQFLDTQPINQ